MKDFRDLENQKNSGLKITPSSEENLFVYNLLSLAIIGAQFLFFYTLYIQKEMTFNWAFELEPLYLALICSTLIASLIFPDKVFQKAKPVLLAKNQSLKLAHYFLPHLIRYGLLDFVSVLALVWASQKKNVAIFVPFACLSLFLMLLNFPTRKYLMRKLA